MVANKYELSAIYDSRKSFYGKAVIIQVGDWKELISYDTKVAYIDKDGAHIIGLFSQTTTRHIKEFLQQNGFKIGTAKELMQMYGC